jgi:hypothetical protein
MLIKPLVEEGNASILAKNQNFVYLGLCKSCEKEIMKKYIVCEQK